MMEMYNTMLGMSEAFETQNGSINWAKAPPNGFAKLITAVAATLPVFVNHRSEYLVGADKTKGCASPVKICPNMSPPKFPCGPDLVAAYLVQFPSRMRIDAVIMDIFGPPRCKVNTTRGDMNTKAKRKAVLSQLMLDGVTL